MEDMYKNKTMKRFMDENNTLRWAPEYVLAVMIGELIDRIDELIAKVEVVE